MKKIIAFIVLLSWLLPIGSLAQGLHFGLKGGFLGNKASVRGLSSQYKEGILTGFQMGPMIQYQTGFHGLTLDFSLLYVQRGIKITHETNNTSVDIKTQSVDIPIELKWEMGLSKDFDMFLGVGPSFSFLFDKDNWGRKLAHLVVDVLEKDLNSMGWRSTEVGLNVGGGVKLIEHLMFSCYYNIGLSSSAKHHIGGNAHGAIDDLFDGNVFETKNRYWQLSFAYIF